MILSLLKMQGTKRIQDRFGLMPRYKQGNIRKNLKIVKNSWT